MGKLFRNFLLTCLKTNSFTHGYLSQRKKNLCSGENRYMNDHNSLIRNSLKLETAQKPSDGWETNF